MGFELFFDMVWRMEWGIRWVRLASWAKLLRITDERASVINASTY